MQKKDYPKLRECPFCGAEARLYEGNIYWVYCTDCGIEQMHTYSAEDAIKQWNTRTNTIPVGNGEDYEVTHNGR